MIITMIMIMTIIIIIMIMIMIITIIMIMQGATSAAGAVISSDEWWECQQVRYRQQPYHHNHNHS